MNSTLIVWLQSMGLLAAEVAIMVGIASQAQRLAKSAAWRRTIWHACILGLLALLVCEFTGVSRGVFARIGKTSTSAVDSISKARNTSHLQTAIPFNEMPVGSSSLSLDPTAHLSGDHKTNPSPALPEIGANPSATHPDAGTMSQASRKSPSAAPKSSDIFTILWFSLIWMFGAVLVFGRIMISRVVLETLRWKQNPVESSALQGTVKALARELGLRRRIRLIESRRFCSPAAFGVLRPTIGLPPQFSQTFNSIQQQAMLAHELAHLSGKDPVWYLLADLLTAALWWHPLIWWSRHQMQAQSELSADEASLLVANGPEVLAECLVELGARLVRTRSLVPMGVAGNGFKSGLGRRVEQLVKLEGAGWRPPSRIRCGVAGTLGAFALVAAVILCTAWVVPPALIKGDNMQTMKQTWKKSLAALALLTTLNHDSQTVLAETTDPQTAAKPDSVIATAPGTKSYGSASAGGGSSISTVSSHQYSDKLARLSPVIKTSKEKQQVEEKLRNITLASVKYDGLPLPEVINNLIEMSVKQVPDGINFVLDRHTSGTPVLSIDPATGLPLPPGSETVDLGTVTVKIDPALKNIRLIDVLEIITKTSDQPIKYSIEDYGVLFSAGSAQPHQVESLKLFSQPKAKPAVDSSQVMTFKIDTNTFFVNMERTFGEKLLQFTPSQISATLKDIFQRSLGLDMNAPNKAVFYNVANNILMVRGTSEDVAATKGAIEMLGGMPYAAPGVASSGGIGGGTSNGH